MEQNEAVISCKNGFVECHTSKHPRLFLLLGLGLSCGMKIYLIMKIIRYFILKKKFFSAFPPKAQWILDRRVVQIWFFLMALLSFLISLYMLNQYLPSFENCMKWRKNFHDRLAIAQWISFYINFMFFSKLVMEFIAENYSPRLFAILLESTLLLQQFNALFTQQYSYAFEFFVLYRCLTSYFTRTFRMILNYFTQEYVSDAIIILFKVVVYLHIIAGLFQTIEEWHTQKFTHLDLHKKQRKFMKHHDYLYFSITTLSSVGFGDITPSTIAGRILVCLIIITCIPLYIYFAVELAQWVSTVNQSFKQLYFLKARKGLARVVITGNIKPDLLEVLLTDFIYHSQDNFDKKIIVVDDNEANQSIILVKIQKFLNVGYYNGTIKDTHVLKALFSRVIICKELRDCLILINDIYSKEFEIEDEIVEGLIYWVKQHTQEVRIIALVNSLKFKCIIENLPSWNQEDCVICVEEFLDHLLCQNALVPGSVTLITNMFSTNEFSQNRQYVCDNRRLKVIEKDHKHYYLYQAYNNGKGYSLYIHSQTFPYNILFDLAAEFYYLQGVILLGYYVDDGDKRQIMLLPEYTIQGTYGIFLAKSFSQVEKLCQDYRNHPEIFADSDSKLDVRDYFIIQTKKTNIGLFNICTESQQHNQTTIGSRLSQNIVVEVNENHKEWLTSSSCLKDLDHVIFNTSIKSAGNTEIEALRIAEKLKPFNIQQKNPATLSFKLKNPVYTTWMTNLSCQNRMVWEPEAMGMVVYPKMALDVIPFVYRFPLLYKAMYAVLAGEDCLTVISSLQVKERTRAKHCFNLLVKMNRVMLGISRKLEENNDVSIVVTNPPPDFIILPTDYIIVLQRT